MLQSPSWEANRFEASQEIPRISRNPKVHYRTHKRPPPVPILGQPNPVHIPTSHLLEIHPNIIHPSTPRSPQWSPSLRFPHQDPIHPPLLTHTRHMPCPSHSSRFYHPHNYRDITKSYNSLRSVLARDIPRIVVKRVSMLFPEPNKGKLTKYEEDSKPTDVCNREIPNLQWRNSLHVSQSNRVLRINTLIFVVYFAKLG